MSWNQPPNQGYGPPGQAGYPPQGGYPNQGHAPYPPQQGGFPPPQGHSPYPQQQQPYGAPPHQQQQFGGPPPQQYGAPPPGQFGHQQPPQGHSPYPQQQNYGAPPPMAGPPALPSPGYDTRVVANVDTTRDIEQLRSSMKGFGTKETALIQAIARIPDPVYMAAARRQYDQRFHRNLLVNIKSETSGYFCEGLEACVRGPLEQDVYNLHDALHGAGTKESVLNDVLLGRSNADINAIKAEYHRVHHRSLEQDIRDDLSMKTERLFDMVLSARRAEESAPVYPQDVDHCVTELHRATEGTKMGTDQITVCQILSSHSDGQIRAISHAFNQKYHQPLDKLIAKEFAGHMEDALLRMLYVAEDRAMADAKALEDTMKGPGTKDRLLTNRVVRIHWDKQHMGQVKGAYKHHFKRDLTARIKGETSGNYEKFLVAMVDGA